MKTIILIFWSFFYFIMVSVQETPLYDYPDKTNLDKRRMEKMYQNKWYIEQMKVKINSVKPKDTVEDYYNIAVCYASEEQVDSACLYLLKCIKLSPNYNSQILTDTDFDLLHQSPHWEKIVRQVVSQGEASKESLVLLEDIISVQLKGMQVYGTQVFQVKDSITGKLGKYTYYPIRNESKVDSLRKSMDLIPLKQYFALFGIDYKPVIE